MARFSDRVRFTVPKDVKDGWKREAARRGMSLSAFLRDAVDDLIAVEDLGEAFQRLKDERGFAHK